MSLILKKLDKIEKRLDKIENDIENINEGIKRNDANINLITRLYFILRDPIIELLKATENYSQIEKNTKLIRN